MRQTAYTRQEKPQSVEGPQVVQISENDQKIISALLKDKTALSSEV